MPNRITITTRSIRYNEPSVALVFRQTYDTYRFDIPAEDVRVIRDALSRWLNIEQQPEIPDPADGYLTWAYNSGSYWRTS